MNLNDKALLDKFRVKESSNLFGLENFEVIEFSIIMAWGGTPPISQKMTKYPTIEVATPNFYILPLMSLLPPLLLWDIKEYAIHVHKIPVADRKFFFVSYKLKFWKSHIQKFIIIAQFSFDILHI